MKLMSSGSWRDPHKGLVIRLCLLKLLRKGEMVEEMDLEEEEGAKVPEVEITRTLTIRIKKDLIKTSQKTQKEEVVIVNGKVEER